VQSSVSDGRIWVNLADGVLVLHVAVVVFVVGGLVAIWLGRWRGVAWFDRPGFRFAHAAAIAFVVAESWLGLACPLTTLEHALRRQSGALAPVRPEGFIAEALSRLLYWDAPAWVFTFAYTAFGVLVAATWWRLPPRRDRE